MQTRGGGHENEADLTKEGHWRKAGRKISSREWMFRVQGRPNGHFCYTSVVHSFHLSCLLVNYWLLTYQAPDLSPPWFTDWPRQTERPEPWFYIYIYIYICYMYIYIYISFSSNSNNDNNNNNNSVCMYVYIYIYIFFIYLLFVYLFICLCSCSEVYGLLPRLFDFDRGFWMAP